MEQKYWIGRKQAAMGMARRADSAEARLIHLHMAGCYSVKAAEASAGVPLPAPSPALEPAPAAPGPTPATRR